MDARFLARLLRWLFEAGRITAAEYEDLTNEAIWTLS